METKETPDGDAPSSARSARRLGGQVPALAVLASLTGIALFAYRGLLTYDPLAKAKGNLDEVEGAFFSPTDSDPTLIFALTCLFLYTRRLRLAAAGSTPPSLVLAIPLLAAACALCVWAQYVQAPELLVPSLSLMFLGGGALWGGRAGCRVLLVPAIFLMFAYRPPGIIINQIIYPLQLIVIEFSQKIVGLLGIASQTSGDMIFVRGRIFHVIERCAGLRSIETLLMASVVYVEIMGCPRLRAGLIIALAPLVGMVSNQIRVLSLIFNPLSSFASIHTAQGIVMIVVGVLIIAGLDWILRWLLPRGRRHWVRPATPPSILAPHLRPRLAVLAILLASLGATTVGIGIWTPMRNTLPRLSSLPPSIEDWRGSGRPLDKEFIGSVGFSEWVNRRYTDGNHEVTLFMASDNRLEPRVSIVSRKNLLLGSGWEIQESQTLELVAPKRTVEASIQSSRFADSENHGKLVYSWYEGVESLPRETVRAVLALDRGNRRREDRALFLRVSTPIRASGVEAARQTLDGFLLLAQDAMAGITKPQS